MEGLVFELQRDLLNRNTDVSDLLRKALVISKKLNVSTIENWLNSELDGYKDIEEIPDYRLVVGEVKLWNRYNGWIPCNFQDVEIAEGLSKRKISQPIGQLASLISGNKSGNLHMPYPQDLTNSLMRMMTVPLQPYLQVPASEVIRILDSVRNQLLNFSLQLEKEGVIGEGMSFSKDEKETAKQITYNFNNHIENMNHSQIQQSSTGNLSLTSAEGLKELKQLISEIRDALNSLSLSPILKSEYLIELETIEVQTKSPKPKEKIIKESLKTLRSILEGITGSLIASGLASQMDKFIK